MLGMVGEEPLDLGDRDDRVLVLAQNVLELGGQADEPLCLPEGAAAQGWCDQLGSVTGRLADLRTS